MCVFFCGFAWFTAFLAIAENWKAFTNVVSGRERHNKAAIKYCYKLTVYQTTVLVVSRFVSYLLIHFLRLSIYGYLSGRQNCWFSFFFSFVLPQSISKMVNVISRSQILRCALADRRRDASISVWALSAVDVEMIVLLKWRPLKMTVSSEHTFIFFAVNSLFLFPLTVFSLTRVTGKRAI